MPTVQRVAWVGTAAVVLAFGVATTTTLGLLPAALAIAAIVIGVALGYQDHSMFALYAARVMGVLGSVIAVLSVVSGLLGGYVDRLGFAVMAVVFAALVAPIPFMRRVPPSAAGAAMFLAGLLGFVATLPWYVHTYYSSAVPLWLVAAGLLVARGLAQARSRQERA